MTRLAFIPPMTPTLVDKPPQGDDWATEIKFDGWRCQIIVDADGVRVFTRRGHDWTRQLKIIADAAATEISVKSAIIDGELVYPRNTGHSDFAALQAVIRSQPQDLIFMAFDLLHFNGFDWRPRPLQQRREKLDGLIAPRRPHTVLGEPCRHACGPIRGSRAYGTGGHRLQAPQLALRQRRHDAMGEDQMLD